MTAEIPLLTVSHLTTCFYIRGREIRAVDDINLNILRGQTLGLVGESGCGKSVTAHSIIRLIPTPPGKITAGRIEFEGTNLLELSEREMRSIRGNRISMIFQEPMTSLNPVYTVGNQVGETIRVHQKLSKAETRNRVIDVFRLVKIPAPEKRIHDFPHQMSGGMRQRVMIAMALACNPRLMIADEPSTALDVTIQAQILDLMNQLKQEMDASILFITHDLGVIAEMAQHVAVMYAGHVVEYTDVETIFANPKHPYTVGLLNSIPVLGQKMTKKRLSAIPGMVPSLFNLPSGCRFSDRCPDVFDDCRKIEPDMITIGPGHIARCLKYA
ncbi:MAG: ABC transporter ATP-binding protein [Desulfatirhabdiaceae bacterium]